MPHFNQYYCTGNHLKGADKTGGELNPSVRYTRCNFKSCFFLSRNLCDTTSFKPTKIKGLSAAPSRLSLALCEALQRQESCGPFTIISVQAVGAARGSTLGLTGNMGGITAALLLRHWPWDSRLEGKRYHLDNKIKDSGLQCIFLLLKFSWENI